MKALAKTGVLMLVFVLGCMGGGNSVDADGRAAKGTVAAFLANVSSNDYASARALWFGAPAWKYDTNVSDEVKFARFCERYTNVVNVLLKEGHGKAGWTIVDLSSHSSGGERVDMIFGLKLVDGSWRISRDNCW